MSPIPKKLSNGEIIGIDGGTGNIKLKEMS